MSVVFNFPLEKEWAINDLVIIIEHQSTHYEGEFGIIIDKDPNSKMLMVYLPTLKERLGVKREQLERLSPGSKLVFTQE